MSVKPKRLFEKADTTYNFPEMEERILAFWDAEGVFEETLAKDSPKGNWVFYEGPPTANGMPHPGHVLTRVIKDCLPRYKTMQGYYVPRQAGWDTHGLPVELSVEKELLASGEMTDSGPKAIIDFGLEKFNRRCFDSVRRYEQEWVRLSNRIGFWLDYEKAYVTFTNQYIESVWWLLKQFYEKGLMYKGYRIQWYSTLVGTGLSSHEVAQNWQTVKDPSVWVRAHVPKGTSIGNHVANENTYFLLWTTTPWTLLSNVALAVHPEFDYVVVEFHNEQQDRREYLVLAEGLLAANGLDAETVVERVKGRDLGGLACPTTSCSTTTSLTSAATWWRPRAGASWWTTTSPWRTARGSCTSRRRSARTTTVSASPRTCRCSTRSTGKDAPFRAWSSARASGSRNWTRT